MLGAERGLRLLTICDAFSRQTQSWLQLIWTGSFNLFSTAASWELVTLSSDRRLYRDLVAQLQEPLRIFLNWCRAASSVAMAWEQHPFEASTVLMRSGAHSLIIIARSSGRSRLVSQKVRMSPLPWNYSNIHICIICRVLYTTLMFVRPRSTHI